MKRPIRRPFYRSWELVAGLLCGALFALLFLQGIFTGLENLLIDTRFKIRPIESPSKALVLVSITDDSIKRLGAWPWPRALHARILSILKAAGAKVVAFDVMFREPSQIDENDDRIFADAIASAGNVILPVVRTEKMVLDPDSCEMVKRIMVVGAIPLLQKSALDEGFIDIESQKMNADGVIRHLILERTASDRTYGVLGLVVASHLRGTPFKVAELPLYTRMESFQGEELTSFMLPYAGPNRHFDDISFEDVIDRRFPADLFRGKAVIIGTRATGTSEDVKFTPFGAAAGMEIHANLIQSLLSGRFLHRLPVWAACVMLMLLAIGMSYAIYRWIFGASDIFILVGILIIWPLAVFMTFRLDLILEAVPVLVMLTTQWASMRLAQQFFDLSERNRELAKRVRELSIVNEVSQAVNFMGDLGKTLDTILSRANMALGAERGSILLLDERYESLVEEAIVVGVEGPTHVSNDLKASFKIGEGIAGEVFSKGTARLITDIKSVKEFKGIGETATASSIRSLICVPLQVRDSPIGIMNIVNKMGGEFDHDDLQLALTMANQAAVVIEKARLFNLATIDGLTGLIVHRHFQAKIEEEFRRAKRYEKPLSFLMTDIDHFKKFNDTYGHQIGDLVLREVAKCVRAAIRDTDIAARYGGEEFAIILPETDEEGASLFAERLRQKIETSAFSSTKGDLKVTISLGLSSIPVNPPETAAEMIKLADEALYEAKHSGRNRVGICAIHVADTKTS
ncbi:MAG: diguanylate cyclase [Candidatus Riflebacteria bacterium]|nr:diguanylate cyclase [Candidatus Riflebacteria bacterium]